METVISGASGDNNNVGQNIHADWESILHALGINKLAHAITEEDIVGKQLPSIYHWKTFYQQYSRGKGFSIRVENVRKKSDGIEWQRRWVCSREGFRRDKWLSLENRKKKPKEITRIGCKAFLRVSLNKTTNNWYAAAFKTEHNHDLASPSELQFLRSHRQVPDSMLAQAQSMRRAGIRTMSIIEYMAQQCGGRDKLPFMPKDLYNKLGSSRLAVGEETDSEGALGYLTCLAVKDDYFFCRFNVDEEDRLHTIFWADGISRNDYNVFGDVLAFDTTYRTNAYNKPLLIFVGVNHHFRTCVYGVALLADETLSTFSWVLSQFLECMGSRPPKVVLTDGDPAMKKAISLLLPHAVHRLCAWHLSGNAISNVPNGEFKIQFSKLMYNYYTEQEFEERWAAVIQENHLEGNLWVSSVYEKKKNWAETFLRGNFFGGMRTTQRCESMNSYMRRFLDSKHLLRDFVSHIDQGIQSIRYTEMEDDFKTKHTNPLIPSADPLKPLFEQFAMALTRNIYDIVAIELTAQNQFSVTSSEFTTDCTIYHLSKYTVGEIRHNVRFFRSETRLSCTCLLLETDGIPCRHIFTVMKHLSLQIVPDSMLRPCWKKDAKLSFNIPRVPSSPQATQDFLYLTRLGTLTSDFNTMGFYAAKFEDTFSQARTEIMNLTSSFKRLFNERQGPTASNERPFDSEIAAQNNIIKDPIKAKTKGREKEQIKPTTTQAGVNREVRRKRCRLCNELGHNRATCRTNRPQPSTTADYSTPTHPMHQPHFSQFSEYPNDLSDQTRFDFGEDCYRPSLSDTTVAVDQQHDFQQQ